MICERSLAGTRSLWKWEGFVEKVGFEPGVKEWKSRPNGCWEWWWWQRWADKWMRRWIETWLARLTKLIFKFIPKTTWCIPNALILNSDCVRYIFSNNCWVYYVFRSNRSHTASFLMLTCDVALCVVCGWMKEQTTRHTQRRSRDGVVFNCKFADFIQSTHVAWAV